MFVPGIKEPLIKPSGKRSCWAFETSPCSFTSAEAIVDIVVNELPLPLTICRDDVVINILPTLIASRSPLT